MSRRPLFVHSEEAGESLSGFFPGTDKPYSARREALNILSLADQEGVDVQGLADHLGPLMRDGHWPQGLLSDSVKTVGGGRLDAEALLSLALLMVLHRNQYLYSQLRRALDTGDSALLISTVAEMITV